jgi:hypothetical protein
VVSDNCTQIKYIKADQGSYTLNQRGVINSIKVQALNFIPKFNIKINFHKPSPLKSLPHSANASHLFIASNNKHMKSKCFLLYFLLVAATISYAQQNSLVDTWKLVSSKVTMNDSTTINENKAKL